MSALLAHALARAEDRLRALGYTGGQAFDLLLPALEERLGLRPADPPDERARAAAAELPLEPGSDLLGLAYERFFADLFKGLRGQFFTPEPIGRLLVARLGLTAGEIVLDPTCGSGGLLVQAARLGATVRGIELDARLARLASLNLELAGAKGSVTCADLFRSEPEPVDALVANPPFSVDIEDPELLSRYELGRGKARVSSDQLFVEAIERWVRPGGRAGLVLPFSVLTNESLAPLRERIDRHWVRLGACTLPEGVFRPFGGAAGRAILLWLERRPAQPRPCLWAELTDPGYDVRSQRYRPTSLRELEALCQGQGFVELPEGAWTPPVQASGVPLSQLASLVGQRAQPPRAGQVGLAELADADRATGELHPRQVEAAEISGAKVVISPGDVLVSQLRPNLGNVAIAPPGPQLVGSPEWIVLKPRAQPHLLLHLLRTPTWRGRLPVTTGQTRPRVRAEAVLDTALRWPADHPVGSAIEALSSRLLQIRREARQALLQLQGAIDRYAAGEIDEDELLEAVTALGGTADPALPARSGLGEGAE